MKVFLYLTSSPFAWVMIIFLIVGIICLLVAYKHIDKDNKSRILLIIASALYILGVLYSISMFVSAIFPGFKTLGG